MSDAVPLGRFRELIGSGLGLRIDDSGLESLARLLRTRAQASAGCSVLHYVERLAGAAPGDAEWLQLAQSLTVGETFFFRAGEQLAVVHELVLQRRREGGPPLRVLCAGCATGEEPYSLTIAAHESGAGAGELFILGVDVSERAIARARQGHYSAWSLRQTPAALRARCFEPRGRGYTLRAPLRAAVRFEQQNLVDPKASLWNDGPFDVVLCRNVLMYFLPQAARETVARIAAVLGPGGLLLLGHAETLRGLSEGFELEHSGDAFYYRRCGAARRGAPLARAAAEPARAAPPPPPWLALAAQAQRAVAGLLACTPAADIPREPVAPPLRPPAARSPAQPALRAPARLLHPAATELPAALGEAEQLLQRALRLLDGGEAEAAEPLCQRALQLDDLSATAHYVLALCRAQQHDGAAAIEHARIATYLAPQFALPHLHLGLLLRRRGEPAAARRELTLAAELLEGGDPRTLLLAGSCERSELIALCRSALAVKDAGDE